MIAHNDFCKHTGIKALHKRSVNVVTVDNKLLSTVDHTATYADFFSFILIEAGQADYLVNSRRLTLATGDLIALTPKQMVAIENPTSDFSATYVTVDISLLENIFTFNISCKVLADSFITNRLPYGKASEVDTSTASKTIHLMHDIQDAEILNNKEEMLTHLLQVLVMNFSDVMKIHSNHGAISHQEIIYRNFIALVGKNYTRQHSTKFYAESLSITPVYLARIVRRFSQKTVKEFILSHVYRDAADMLKYSDFQVGEIAQKLGFPNVETFSKFFKKKSGVSPMDVRHSQPQPR